MLYVIPPAFQMWSHEGLNALHVLLLPIPERKNSGNWKVWDHTRQKKQLCTNTNVELFQCVGWEELKFLIFKNIVWTSLIVSSGSYQWKRFWRCLGSCSGDLRIGFWQWPDAPSLKWHRREREQGKAWDWRTRQWAVERRKLSWGIILLIQRHEDEGI